MRARRNAPGLGKDQRRAASPFRWDWRGHDSAAPARGGSRPNKSGRHYTLAVEEPKIERPASHVLCERHGCWRNLPDELADEYPDMKRFAKKALIRCGFRDERSIRLRLEGGGARVAAFITPIDRYAIVVQVNAVVRVWTARFQSVRAMGKAEFKESSADKVLAFCADLIGVAG